MRRDLRAIVHVTIIAAGGLLLWLIEVGSLLALKSFSAEEAHRVSEWQRITLPQGLWTALLLSLAIAAILSAYQQAPGTSSYRRTLGVAVAYGVVSFLSRWSFSANVPYDILLVFAGARLLGTLLAGLLMHRAKRSWLRVDGEVSISAH